MTKRTYEAPTIRASAKLSVVTGASNTGKYYDNNYQVHQTVVPDQTSA